jgi:nucleotide-binding universal stress UspA family protein
MYSQILTPLDGSEVSERVLPFARSLAEGLSLPMTLLYAIEPELLTIPQALNPSLHVHEMVAHRLRQARGYADPLATHLRNEGLAVQVEVPQREPAEAIVEEAGKDEGTLITMSSHGRSGLARWWMGSVTDKVLHLTNNPLLVIHATSGQQAAAESSFQHITVPVDGSELAESILPHAVYLSLAMNLAIGLVRVNPSRDDYYRSLSIGPSEVARVTPSYEEYIQIVDAEAEGYLAELKGRLTQQGVASVETRLMHGPPADTIADLAASTPNNLVAMTTHGRSGVGRMVLGSVAERVVRQSGDPVLLVRGTRDRQAPLPDAMATA